MERRLLALETLSEQRLNIILLPQIWVHELRNLGDSSSALANLDDCLVPGAWIRVRCIIYSSEDSLTIEAHELVLMGRDSSTRLTHDPSWWRQQIASLADFYLNHLLPGESTPADFGQYRSYLDRNGCVTGDGRQETALLSRLIYGFATAFMLTGNATYLEAAQQGCSYLIDHFSQFEAVDGLVYWFHGVEFDALGEKTVVFASEAGDDLHAIACYEQIYALTGIVQTYRACGDPGLLDICKKTIGFIRKYFQDKSDCRGYYTHIDPLFFSPREEDLGHNRCRKSWNSNGDHVPAYLIQLYLGTKSEEIKDLLVDLQDLLLSRFEPLDGSPFIEERFHENWNSDHAWGWQQNRSVIGHNLKIIWTLLRLDHLNPDARTLSFCKRLAEPLACHGFDRLRGGWFDMMERTSPHHLCWHDRKAWWQQEQAILAFSLLQVAEPSQQRWGALADVSSDFYNSCFLDHDNGGVFFSVTGDGTPWLLGQERLKGSHSMGGYHAFELCFYASLYGNILLRQKEQTLFFKVIPDQIDDGCLNVAPDLMPAGSVEVAIVRINGELWPSFCSQMMTVDLPPGSEPIVVEVTLISSSNQFQLIEEPQASADLRCFLMKGYLSDDVLTVFKQQLESLEGGQTLCLNAVGLMGACGAGLRYLVLLRQGLRHKNKIRIINIPDSLRQQFRDHHLSN